MIKKILPLVTALTLSTQVMANEDMHHEKESKFYVVAKALYTLGDTVEEETTTLDGDTGMGFGLDFGYRLEYGFAVEYDFSYSTNTVHAGAIEADADNMTHALDLVYTYEATEALGLFVKAGYEYEEESLENDTTHDDGAVFGAGAEYALNHNYSLVAEYEHSTIEGPKGDSVFAGVMFNF